MKALNVTERNNALRRQTNLQFLHLDCRPRNPSHPATCFSGPFLNVVADRNRSHYSRPSLGRLRATIFPSGAIGESLPRQLHGEVAPEFSLRHVRVATLRLFSPKF